MKTFLHIVIGFILGVICTLGVLAIIAATSNRMEQIDVPVSYFDAKTKKGKVKLHHENNIYEQYIKKNKTCSNCITDIGNNIKPNKTNPIYFNIYISNQTITNDSMNLKLDKNFSYIEITCKIIGVSQNFIE